MKPVLLVFLYLLPLWVFAQSDTSQVAQKKDNKLFILPVISYSPETSLRFGGIGIYLFRMQHAKPGTQLSSIKAPITYTLNNQPKVRMSYEVFFNDNKHILKGFVQWLRFPLFFYGIGPDTRADEEEIFTSRTVGTEFSYFRKFKNHLFIGARVEWLSSKIVETEEEGLLASEGLIVGSNGGITSGIGLLFRYDCRDNNFNPSTGPFIESSLSTYQEGLGSDFSFTKFRLDARHYMEPFQKHVLAIQLFHEYNWGSPSFESMALLGGDVVMRGHYLGRFRDNAYWAFQSEYRLPINRPSWFTGPNKPKFWERWGLIGFAGFGTVGNDLEDLFENDLQYSLGFGIRFLILPKELVNLRIDFGFGTQSPGFYLNVRESF